MCRGYDQDRASCADWVPELLRDELAAGESAAAVSFCGLAAVVVVAVLNILGIELVCFLYRNDNNFKSTEASSKVKKERWGG